MRKQADVFRLLRRSLSALFGILWFVLLGVPTIIGLLHLPSDIAGLPQALRELLALLSSHYISTAFGLAVGAAWIFYLIWQSEAAIFEASALSSKLIDLEIRTRADHEKIESLDILIDDAAAKSAHLTELISAVKNTLNLQGGALSVLSRRFFFRVTVPSLIEPIIESYRGMEAQFKSTPDINGAMNPDARALTRLENNMPPKGGHLGPGLSHPLVEALDTLRPHLPAYPQTGVARERVEELIGYWKAVESASRSYASTLDINIPGHLGSAEQIVRRSG